MNFQNVHDASALAQEPAIRIPKWNDPGPWPSFSDAEAEWDSGARQRSCDLARDELVVMCTVQGGVPVGVRRGTNAATIPAGRNLGC